MITCRCGKLVESMCAQCSAASFVVEAARRRPGLLARLDRDRGFDEYEAAMKRTLARLRTRGLLTRVNFGTFERTPDVDWFLASPRRFARAGVQGDRWTYVFQLIEDAYQKRLAERDRRFQIAKEQRA